MKAIITGANGFVGSNLANVLLQNGVEVLAIDLSFEKCNIIQHSLLKTLQLSIDHISKLIEIINCNEYDLFYHLAWIGVNGPEKGVIDNQLKNISMVIDCATVAKQIGCSKFLCAGTVAEYNVDSLKNVEKTGAGMFYGASKHCAHLMLETYCKNIGLNFVWMQFSNIYGPSNKTGNLVSYTLGELMNDRPAIFGPAQQPYDFIFVDDLIKAVYLLGIKKTTKNFYFIGSGKPRILSDYLLEIGFQCGKKDLIRIGERIDDGIKYSFDMFDNFDSIEDIGDYVSMSFEEGIKYTISKY